MANVVPNWTDWNNKTTISVDHTPYHNGKCECQANSPMRFSDCNTLTEVIRITACQCPARTQSTTPYDEVSSTIVPQGSQSSTSRPATSDMYTIRGTPKTENRDASSAYIQYPLRWFLIKRTITEHINRTTA